VQRVVIIDDDRGMRLLARMTAEEVGCSVVGDAATAERGIAAVARLRPDVVIMDYRLPDLDGAEATRRLLELVPETTVVAWTSSTDPDVAEALLAAGAVEVITKREFDRLRASLERVAQRETP
jgi:DNA-binding NarL/FixJ family response regulator